MTGVAKKSVKQLSFEVGMFYAEYQDKVFRNLKCKCLQLDEVWSWIYCKDKTWTRKIAAKNAAASDIWLWVAMMQIQN